MFKAETRINPLTVPANYLAIIPIGLVGAAIYAPVMNSFSYPNGEVAYEFLSKICHQDFFRSHSILGQPCGLCARCLGGYIGVSIGLLSINRPKRFTSNNLLFMYSIGTSLLLVAIIDALVKFGDGNWYRFFSGGAGGLGFGLMLMVLSSFYRVRKK